MLSLYERAAVIPGRAMTRSKAPDRLRKAWATEGLMATVHDTQGNNYIDMVCALGAISLGYDMKEWWDQPRGVYSLPHEREVEAAEAVLKHVAPWASSVRFVKTGSEATHAAYRIAKKATGCARVVMLNGAYHGWHEWTEQTDTDFEVNVSVPRDGEPVAAVFVEPPRFQTLNITWLRAVREWCDRNGALLVFDEMIWGGRYKLGGCSEYSGVIPDLACYGKAFGNGEAVAFVVGREALAEHGEMVSGTFSGDVTGLSAVVDTLRVYITEPVIETLWARGRQLMDGLRWAIPPTLGIIEGSPVHPRIRFTDPQTGQPYDYRPSEARPLTHRFKEAMAERGVLVYPDWLMVMYAHTPEQIDTVIEAAAQSVKELR